MEIRFSGPQTIARIDVFTLQDAYTTPVDPAAASTFSTYGITSFQVQTWTGSAWADVPGGNVTGNNLVWRQFNFAPVTTERNKGRANKGAGFESICGAATGAKMCLYGNL